MKLAHVASFLALVLSAAACRATPDRPAPRTPPAPVGSTPGPSVSATAEPPSRGPGRYLISLDPWKQPITWFCFRNLKNAQDPSVCVQGEAECELERAAKKKHAGANGVAFEGSACKRTEDPHCTFMYVREGRVTAPTETGTRETWSASEKVNTCCNYICAETEAECSKQVDQFRTAVLREGEREREQMSCDIPCQRWSAFPAAHDRDHPLVCQRNHE